jgi:Flp pilus assembly protein CpaB
MQIAHKLMATRGGTLAIGGVAAVLAAGVFLLYLKRYRASIQAAQQPMPVLLASGVIEKGTPGDVIGSEEMFQPSTTPKDKLKDGAIADPALLRGKVATEDIFPGEQLTVASFAAAPPNAAVTKIKGYERGIAVPVDAARGMIGHIRTGDRVDVIAGFNRQQGGMANPFLRVLVQDVLVLDAPAAVQGAAVAAGANTQKTVVLRMTDEQAARVAFARDNGEIWIVLRPRAGVQQSKPSLVTAQTMLLGTKPMRIKP